MSKVLSGEDIGYLSETDSDYAKSLRAATTIDKLRTMMRKYQKFAPDANAIVDKMDARGFMEFRGVLESESKGRFSGEAMAKKYGAMLLPALFLHIGMVCVQFKVPFGVAWIRSKESGLITQDDDGSYRWNPKP